jgi:hypothetical protein
MNEKGNTTTGAAILLGVLLAAGLGLLGYQLTGGLQHFRGATERVVTVKGLAEREVPADTAIWPIRFDAASDDLEALYATLERQGGQVAAFLREAGFAADAISQSAPAITDRRAQGYGNPNAQDLRYAGNATVTVYTREVEKVRQSMRRLTELGRQGIAISGPGLRQPYRVPLHRPQRHQAGDDRGGDPQRTRGRGALRGRLGEPPRQDPHRQPGPVQHSGPRQQHGAHQEGAGGLDDRVLPGRLNRRGQHVHLV